MATLLSIPTTVTVLTPGSSVLSTVAAAMAPGTWAQFSARNQNTVLGVGDITGSMLPYTNAMPWNPRRRCIEILARDHQDGAITLGIRHASYDEASNSFISHGRYANFPMGHGYDHTEVNPNTGDLYHKKYGSVGSGPLQVFRQTYGQSAWTELPQISAGQNIIFGTCWWSGPFSGGSGLGGQGGLAVFSSGASSGNASDGFIGIYDPVSNSWPFRSQGMSPFYGGGGNYNAVMAYSRSKNVAVYGGGNVAAQKVWKLSSNGTATALADAPSSISVGIHRGVLVEDPVSGNFLVLSKGLLYELNPNGSGTWTQMTGSRVPPAGVGIPAESGGNNFVMGTPLPDHGVVAFIRQSNAGNGAFWLYKHA